MKYLTVPAAIDVTGAIPIADDKDPNWTFSDFLLDLVLGNLPYKTTSQLEIVRALGDKLVGTEDGTVVELSDAEHEALNKAMPSNMNPRALFKLMDFFDAIVGASAKDPRPKPTEAPDATVTPDEGEAAE